jgi:hypothetical protein
MLCKPEQSSTSPNIAGSASSSSAAAAAAFRLFRWLKPGGRLLFTDYCQPSTPGFSPSAGFAAYIQKHRYSLLSAEGYSQQLAAAGFVDATAQDCTAEVGRAGIVLHFLLFGVLFCMERTERWVCS